MPEMVWTFKGKEFNPSQSHLDLAKFTRSQGQYGQESLPVIMIKFKAPDIPMKAPIEEVFTPSVFELRPNTCDGFRARTEDNREVVVINLPQLRNLSCFH